MVFELTPSTAVTTYYVFNGIVTGENENMTFEEIDALLYEIAQDLTKFFVAEARKFFIELDSFDDYNQRVDLIVSFTIWPYEDDDAEVLVILGEVEKKFEEFNIMIDEKEYIGDGPDKR